MFALRGLPPFLFFFCISRMLLQRGLGGKVFVIFIVAGSGNYFHRLLFCTWFEQGYVLQMGRTEKRVAFFG